MKNIDNMVVQPAGVVGIGGHGYAAAAVFKAVTDKQLNGLVAESDRWTRTFACDFTGGPEPACAEAIARHGAVLQQPLPAANTLLFDVTPLQDAARTRAPGFDNIWRYCPIDLMARSRSSQAAQKAAISRATFIYYLRPIEERIEQMLQILASNGEVLTSLRRQGVAEEQIAQKMRVALVGGSEGGTFLGSVFPAAVLIHSVAKRLNIDIELELWCAFRYRSVSGVEATLRFALGEQFSRDLEVAQTPGVSFEMRSRDNDVYTASGELFSRCVPFEGYRRMNGKSGPLAIAMGEALAFRSIYRDAATLNGNHAQNLLSRDRR